MYQQSPFISHEGVQELLRTYDEAAERQRQLAKSAYRRAATSLFSSKRKRIVQMFFFIIVLLVVVGGQKTAVHAADNPPFIIECGDNGALFNAVAAANQTEGLDTIELAADCIYEFLTPHSSRSTLGQVITDDLIIEGNGATFKKLPVNNTQFDARLIDILAKQPNLDITLRNLSIEGGKAVNGECGGGIRVQHEGDGSFTDLTLESVMLIGNLATGPGGGLCIEQSQTTGKIDIKNSRFIRNRAESAGGAIYAYTKTFQTEGSRFTENYAVSDGGAVSIFAKTVVVERNRILNNSSDSVSSGFVIYALGNTSIHNNIWSANVGAIGSFDLSMSTDKQATLFHNTFISANKPNATAAIMASSSQGQALVKNNIVMGYARAGFIFNPHESIVTSNNLYFANGDDELLDPPASSDIDSADHIYAEPMLDAILRPKAQSPAVDAGVDTGVGEDINGEKRPQGNSFDLGAIESPFTSQRAEAVDDEYEVLAGTTLTVAAPGILENDKHAEYAILLDDRSRANGNLVITPIGEEPNVFDGSFSYTPAPGFVGKDTFEYLAANQSGTSELATFTIDVLASNILPEARNDTYQVDENGTLVVAARDGVLDNDTDGDGDTLTAVLVEDAVFGDFELREDGSFSYTPEANFVGNDRFHYQADDGLAKSNIAIVTIEVKAANRPPVAVDDDYTVAENEVLVVEAGDGVLDNDNDADDDQLEVRLVEEPKFGSLKLAKDGSFNYEPDTDFFGSDSFRYRADDGTERSNTATVTIVVRQVNRPPVATNDEYAVAENDMLVVSAQNGVLDNDNDADDDALTARLVTEPQFGTLKLGNNGSFNYEPDADFFGSDSFRYRADDGTDRSNTATVTIVVRQVNSPPVAASDDYTIDENTILTETAPGVLANDEDADGDGLTAVLTSNVRSGSLSLNPNGAFSYQPAPDFVGSDSFSYRASDGQAMSEPVTVNIVVNNVNVAPTAADDEYVVEMDGVLEVPARGVLANDEDADGDGLSAVFVSNVRNGTLDLDGNGRFSYIPDAGFFGSDSFTYQAFDGQTHSNIATVTIIVEEVVRNVPPEARNNSYEMLQDTRLVIDAPGLLENDSDANGNSLTAQLVDEPVNGRLILNTDGSFSYEPDSGFFGRDSFTYRAFDGQASSNVATVTVAINEVVQNLPPVARPNSYTVQANENLTIVAPGVLDNDEDAEGDGLTAVLNTTTRQGTLTFRPDGSFTYQPNAAFSGSDSFTYHASDGHSASEPSTVTIIVTPLPPVTTHQLFLPIIQKQP
ncbi:MAG: Ig-like domain-containing protein [Chloroflexota bacterium]